MHSSSAQHSASSTHPCSVRDLHCGSDIRHAYCRPSPLLTPLPRTSTRCATVRTTFSIRTLDSRCFRGKLASMLSQSSENGRWLVTNPWAGGRVRGEAAAAAGSAPSGVDMEGGKAALSMLGQLLAGLQQPQQVVAPTGAHLAVHGLTFQPAGAAAPLLQDVSLHLPANSLGLVYGRSGAGKTTLLNLVAGLAQPTAGEICIAKDASNVAAEAEGLSERERAAAAGIVFQFPERHFLGDSILQELTFGWPQRAEDRIAREQLAERLTNVMAALGLSHLTLESPTSALSDGYKRRLALAVQLTRGPSLLLLDEPLAGLDWRSRADIAQLLGKLKNECTLLIVSHDLRELSPLVDHAWEMQPGGTLLSVPWPPADL